MKTALILGFILLLMSFHSRAQQTIDKLNTNQLKLPKESVSKALILDATGQVKSSSTVTDTEVGYLDGLTDTLVNLLSGKANDADVVKLSTNQTVSGIKTFDGKLVTSSTTNGSIPCPGMTQTQRDALTPANGECVYNSTSLKLNIYDGSVWKDVGGSGGISLWATSTGYSVNDVVIQSDKIYICLVAHTSGTFATDLSAAKWNEISKVSTIKSQGVSVSNLDELQIQNYQLTQAGTNKFYVESGNKNILANPSFEHSTFSTGWTNSAGTFTQELTSVIDGVAAAKLILSAQTMSLNQSSILYVGQFADGVQGLASVRVKSDVALKVCSMQNYIVSTTNCVDVQPNSKWGLYKVPFILGATSNGISIASAGAVTGTVYIDDAFVGAVDLQASVDASKVAGESYFAGTASCLWTRTSATLGAFTTVAACPGPTVNYSSMGSWQTTDSDLPRQTINNLPAGTYKATFLVPTYSTASNTNSLTINDGSTTCQAIVANSGASAGQGVVSCVFTYNSSGNRVFELYGASISSTINIENNTATVKNTKFTLEYFGNSSVYSSTNADTDWASCGLTGAAFTGFGSSVPTPELQCKRQGADLLIKGKFTAGTTPTAVEARMALPTWNGVQLVSAGSSVIPSIQLAGPAVLNFSSATYFGFNVLIEPSVSYTTFSLQTNGVNGLTKQIGSAIAVSGQVMSINARIPIQGWQGSNIIVGSFNGLQNCTSTLACTDTFSATISSAGVVANENVDWINGNCTTAVSGINTDYTCSYITGLATQPMNCVSVDTSSSTNPNATRIFTSTSSQFQGSNATGRGINVVCQKQGSDYVGKTALAVASDQNIRTPGVTKAVIYSGYIGAAGGVVSDEVGDLINGSCSGTTTKTCTLNTGAINNGNCTCSVSGSFGSCRIGISSSIISLLTANSAGTATDIAVSYICHGVSP